MEKGYPIGEEWGHKCFYTIVTIRWGDRRICDLVIALPIEWVDAPKDLVEIEAGRRAKEEFLQSLVISTREL